MTLKSSSGSIALVVVTLALVLLLSSIGTGIGPAIQFAQESQPATVPVPLLQDKPDITVPYIELWPDEARLGETVAVRGLNFCPTTACEPLRILVNKVLLLENVSVSGDGRFVAYFNASNPQGAQYISAEQNGQGNRTFRDSKMLIVGRPGSDTPERAAQFPSTALSARGRGELRPGYWPSAEPIVPTPIGPQSPNVIAFQP